MLELSPSDRVAIISDVADRLSGESWHMIDLVLSQCQFSTAHNWHGDQHSYVVAMLSEPGTHDAQLVDLAAHFGNNDAVVRPRAPDPTCWDAGHLRVFLSHLYEQRLEATELQKSLHPYGISSFVAHIDIRPTREWLDQILAALETCDVLIALLHPGFEASDWTDHEVGFVLGRGAPVFSVQYDRAPYGLMAHVQAFVGRNKTHGQLASEIFHGVRQHKATQQHMSELLLTRFEKSGSFAEARTNLTYLEELGVWGDDFTQRVEDALRTNRQISDSHTVPDRVAKLIAKWR